MKKQLLLVIVTLFSSIKLDAQNCTGIDCDFPASSPFGYHDTEGDEYVGTMFYVNGFFFKEAPQYTWGSNFTNVAAAAAEPNVAYEIKDYASLYFCTPARLEKSTIKLIVLDDGDVNGTVDNFIEPKVIDLNIQEIGTGIKLDADSSNAEGTHHEIRTKKIHLTPGVTYVITGTIRYRYKANAANAYSIKNRSIKFYVCVGGLGSSENEINIEPGIKVDCEADVVTIDNSVHPWLEDFVYYWSSTSSDPFNNPDHVGPDFAPPVGSEFWVVGVPPGNGGHTKVSHHQLTSTAYGPNAPTFLGPFVYCSCSSDPVILSVQDEGLNYNWYGNSGSDYTMNEVLNNSVNANLDLFPNSGPNHKHDIRAEDPVTGCLSEPTTFDYPKAATNCNCEGGFQPIPGGRYVVTAWVKEGYDVNVEKYTAPLIRVVMQGGSTINMHPKGKIVDGWQRISEVIQIPVNSARISVEIENIGNKVIWVDDISFKPFNSSMAAYVYNTETFQLMAELDDEGFKTEYIYNTEGGLEKTNIETEDGVRTISETRSHVQKR